MTHACAFPFPSCLSRGVHARIVRARAEGHLSPFEPPFHPLPFHCSKRCATMPSGGVHATLAAPTLRQSVDKLVPLLSV